MSRLPRKSSFSVAVLALVFAGSLTAQFQTPTYRDLTVVRNRPWARNEFLEFRAGVLGTIPSGEDEGRLATREFGIDGHAFLHQNKNPSGGPSIDAYVGRDGAYFGWREGNLQTQRGYTRFEVHGRQWGNFVREGFYNSDNFVPVGSYRMRDWRASLSFATTIGEGIKAEFGGFYGQNQFDRYGDTSPSYTIPENYNVWGVSIKAEENKLEVDPQTNLAFRGSLFSLWADREWNDNNGLFGTAGRETSLPAAVIRGGGHLEYYAPYTNTGTFILQVDGAVAPDDDRVWIYDASKPVGQIYGDLRVDYRWLLSNTLTFRPRFQVQYIKIANEFSTSTDNKFFVGGGAELRFDASESFAIVLEYSYLSNQSREPVLIDRDTIGEHRAFLGVEFRPGL